MQLPRLGKNIAGQNIIQNNILDEIAAVILFIVVLLDAGERDAEHPAHLGGQIIGAGNEHRVFGFHLGAKGFVGDAVAHKQFAVFPKIDRQKVVRLADLGQVAAGNDGGAFVDHADHTVNGVPHLIDQSLEQSV